MPRIARCVAALFAAALISSCQVSRERSSESSVATERDPQKTVTLTFTYGSEKEAWIKDVTDAFNRGDHKIAGGKSIYVEAIPMGSGDCIDEILQGTRETDITSPASAAFIALGNAQSRAKSGADLIGSTDSLVVSPVVIAMWRPMAQALGWPAKPVGWSDILALAREPKGWEAKGHPEWGPFRFGHTHPESSNSGLISILAEVYAASGKKAGLTLADVNSEKTASFVHGIEQSVVHYGSSTGFFGKKMFANGPRYLSAAVLYENMVIESYNGQNEGGFPVVAIYPREGTFWSDHPVGVVNRPWVNADKKEAAKIYTTFLLAKEQQQKAIPFGFRPASVDVQLAAPIDEAHGVDPREPKTTLEVPRPDVMDAILKLWHANKKRANLTLVFDVSGSMQEEQKMDNARDGALQFVSLLDDDDQFSLVPFNKRVRWALRDAPLKQRRTDAEGAIRGLYAEGGTALYDAIAEAYQAHLQNADQNEGKISSIVVLTDGEDTDSHTSLDDLLQRIRFDNETHTIRVFTIGYGKGAKKEVLQRIADATQAKFYQGDPRNIRSILREISTFF
ncbi:MAG TPA: VWA domain-containing protein [Thermoanaerobaculia bacterium]